MKQPSFSPVSRREFLGNTAKIGAGSLLAGSMFGGAARASAAPAHFGTAMPKHLPARPSRVYVQYDGDSLVQAIRTGDRFTTPGAEVAIADVNTGQAVRVTCPKAPLSRVLLRWDVRLPEVSLFLGDHWERSYGDLQWKFLQPERVMPWYFAAHLEQSGETFMAGVMTQPAALCFWMVDADGVSLWLDFRNGGNPSVPGDRAIAAATIVSQYAESGISSTAALTKFCRVLCPSPRLAASPICGNNNWYYAYGRNFDADAMRRDARFLAELAGGHAVRPYCVIDAGWTPGSSAPGGPWTHGDPATFPDMPGLASDMTKLNVRPGIWMRPTALTTVGDPGRLRAGPVHGKEKPLDLTLPENLKLIRDDVARVHGWGYELIKHDFSTFDAFGRWGFRFGTSLTDAGWNFADRTLTNAEIILRLYRTLREAAGDAVLLGCNTIGHLGAGFFEIQRTGDDTSGREWERTRRMGVNTLAYRLSQNRTFFSCDPDCAPHTERTPWELDRQYLDLVARSGAALFVSVDPRNVTIEQKSAFRAAMQTALSGGTPGGCEPLDWLHNTTPNRWRFGSEETAYDWQQPTGVWPLPA